LELEWYRSAIERGKIFSLDEESLWFSDKSTIVEPTPYDVPVVEANTYYAGVGPGGCGPRLIYRTSADKFEEPTGPEAYKRLMRVVAVPDSHELGKNGMWDRVRDRVCGLLFT
jgi:hypothetical protein